MEYVIGGIVWFIAIALGIFAVLMAHYNTTFWWLGIPLCALGGMFCNLLIISYLEQRGGT